MHLKKTESAKSTEEMTRERKVIQTGDETVENKLYPSAESDEDVDLKDMLIN